MSDYNEISVRKSYHHGNLREALIEAGLELINEGGGAQLDLRKVARKAGVSHTAPYRHFSDKKELLAAIAEEGYRELASRVHQALESTSPNTMARLEAFAREYVTFAQQRSQLMREMFSGLVIEAKDYPTLYEAVIGLFQPLRDTLNNGQQTHELVDEDRTSLALVIWSMMHGFSTLLIENMINRLVSSSEEMERLIHLCVHILVHGLMQRDGQQN